MKENFNKFTVLLILFISLNQVTDVFGVTRTASVTGNWDNSATWGGDPVPTSAEDVVINSSITVTVNIANAYCNSINISNGAILTISGTNTLNLNGDWTCNGTFNANSSTVVFAGSSVQTIHGYVTPIFYSLTLNNSSGLTLNWWMQIQNTLTFSSGKITTLGYYLTLGTAGNAGTVTGAGSGKYVYGNLRRFVINAVNPVAQYDIGDANYYTPVSIAFTGTVTGNGYLEASTARIKIPGVPHTFPHTSAISEFICLNRMWTVTNTSVAGFTSYSPTFTYDIHDIAGTWSSPAIKKLDNVTWTSTSGNSYTASTVSCTGLTSFSSFIFGDDASSASLYKWTGNVSTDWNTPGNWSGSSVPDRTKDVVIPGGTARQPVISVAGCECKRFAMNGNASLTINTGLIFSVYGNWISDGTLYSTDATVDFPAASGNRDTLLGQTPFYNFSHTGTGETYVYSSVHVNGTFTISAGVYNASAWWTTVTGMTYLNGGTYEGGTQVQYFNGGFTINNGGYFHGWNSNYSTSNFTINSGGTMFLSCPFHITGNWVNNGGSIPYGPWGNTISFEGSSPQTIGGSVPTTFYTVILNNSSGLVLNTDAQITDQITFTSGKITTNSNYLIIGSVGKQGNVISAGAGKYVYGNMRRYVKSKVDTTVIFDVGDATNYSPVRIAFTGTPASGIYLSVSSTSGTPPVSSGINQTNHVKRYWTVSNTSGFRGYTSYSPTFTYVNPGDISGTLVTPVIRKKDANWSLTSGNSSTSTTSTCTGLTSFSNFYIGNDDCSITNDIWFGSKNTDWNNDSNWCYGVPTSGTDVFIYSDATNQPVIDNPGGTCRNITINSGASLTLNGNSALSVNGNFSNSGTFTPNTGSVIFAAASGTQALNTGGSSFYNISHTGTGVLQLVSNNLTTSGTFTNSVGAGNFDANAKSNTVAGLVTLTSGSYLAGSATQTFNGGLTIDGGTFSGSGGNVSTTNVTLSSGTLTAPSGTFTVLGNWSKSGGTFTSGSNTITFTGNSNINSGGTGSTSQFNNLVLNGTSATLTGNDMVINNNLTITNGIWTVSPGLTMTVSGALSNSTDANLVLQSDATGTANLINYTTMQHGTVQRYLSGNSHLPYHFISSPIYRTPISSIWTTGDYNVMGYDETVRNADIDQGWVRNINDSLVNGKSYAVVRTTNTNPAIFAGKLNTGDISPVVTYRVTAGPPWTRGIDPQGWNLIGNPYPSSIFITDGDGTSVGTNGFLDVNYLKLDGIFTAVYFWDDPGGKRDRTKDYACFGFAGGTGILPANTGNQSTPNGKIGVGQGFFIKLKDKSSTDYDETMNFHNNQRIGNNSTQYFIPDLKTVQLMRFSVLSPDSLYNEILLSFISNASKGFDIYDVGKLKGNADIALYSILSDKDFAIQGLPPITEKMEIPLGLDISKSGDYTFFISQKENFTSQFIYLKDLLLNKLIDLNKDSFYKFNTDSGQIRSRFVIVFSPVAVVSINQVQPPALKVFVTGKTLTISNTMGNHLDGSVIVTDMLGQVLFEKVLSGKSSTEQIGFDQAAGYYIITVQSNKQIKKAKVFIPR